MRPTLLHGEDLNFWGRGTFSEKQTVKEVPVVLVWFTPAFGTLQYVTSKESFVLHTFQRVMIILSKHLLNS